MDLLVFPHIKDDPFEKIPAASFPASGIGFCFANLIFIPTFQEEKFLAAGDDTYGIYILGSDVFLFCSQKIQAEKRAMDFF